MHIARMQIFHVKCSRAVGMLPRMGTEYNIVLQVCYLFAPTLRWQNLASSGGTLKLSPSSLLSPTSLSHASPSNFAYFLLSNLCSPTLPTPNLLLPLPFTPFSLTSSFHSTPPPLPALLPPPFHLQWLPLLFPFTSELWNWKDTFEYTVTALYQIQLLRVVLYYLWLYIPQVIPVAHM